MERLAGLGDSQAAFMNGLAAAHDAVAVARSNAPVCIFCVLCFLFLSKGGLGGGGTKRGGKTSERKKRSKFPTHREAAGQRRLGPDGG